MGDVHETKNGRMYTEREVVEAIQNAKRRLIVDFIHATGFDASWILGNSTPMPDGAPTARQTGPTRPAGDGEGHAPHGRCNVCNEPKIRGNWGPYCRPCHIRKKETRWQQGQRNW